MLQKSLIENIGPVRLLVLQGTSFCNINCTYCYLSVSDRQEKRVLSVEVIMQLCDQIALLPLSKNVDVLWHSGEPLTLPIDYYEELFPLIQNKFPSINITHVIQTNGILINDEWCNLFKKYNVRVGVSIDGPEFINDRNRKNKRGNGTFDIVLRGINALVNNEIDFSIIAVLTSYSIDYPDEIYSFFKCLAPKNVAFNIDEIDGVNNNSSFENVLKEKLVNFYKRIIYLQQIDEKPLVVRDIEDAKKRIINYKEPSFFDAIQTTMLTTPFAIITCDYKGRYSTFSPELINMKSTGYDDFYIGDVTKDILKDTLNCNKLKTMYQEIQDGIMLCKSKCKYFGLCKGGTPSNKVAEKKSFTVAETVNCLMSYQAPIDAVLETIKSRILI